MFVGQLVNFTRTKREREQLIAGRLKGKTNSGSKSARFIQNRLLSYRSLSVRKFCF